MRSVYYICEAGVYSQEQYKELDEGLGLIEIGQTVEVDTNLLPDHLKEDDELVCEEIDKWFNSFGDVEKPLWLK